MGLQEKLDTLKRHFRSAAPKEVLAVLDEAIQNVIDSDILERALGVGQQAPDFTLKNTSGKKLNLHDMLKKGPVVLTFFRGRWCPNCNLELEALEAWADRFRQEGARLLAISPQVADLNKALKDNKQLSFDLLSDPGNGVADQFGIKYTLSAKLARSYSNIGIRLDEYNGDDSWTLPLAARFIIDGNGTIRYAVVNADYTIRPEPEETLAALKTLNA